MQPTTLNNTECAYNGTGNEIMSERRLWLAVLTQAVEDWRGGTLKARRSAQQFIFEHADFDMVCANAGMDAGNLRSKLLKLGRKVQAQGSWTQHPMAA